MPVFVLTESIAQQGIEKRQQNRNIEVLDLVKRPAYTFICIEKSSETETHFTYTCSGKT